MGIRTNWIEVDLNAQRIAFSDTLRKFLEEKHDFQAKLKIQKSSIDYDAELYQALIDLGVAHILIGEAQGGMGGTLLDGSLMAMEFGRALLTSPIIETACYAAPLFNASEPEKALPEGLLDSIMEGKCQIAYAKHNPKTCMVQKDHLIGLMRAVRFGGSADYLFVQQDKNNLWLVDLNHSSIHKDACRLLDGSVGVNLQFQNTPLIKLTIRKEHAGYGQSFLVMRCAEAIGIMGRSLHDCLDYAKTRKQFGQAIGSFQVIQHNLAQMALSYETCLALCLEVAAGLSDSGTEDDDQLYALLYLVDKLGKAIGEAGIQLHGGMGMMQEMPLGAALMRLDMLTFSSLNADQAIDQMITTL